ncbi:helix-turn-helix transcriptional regulator [Rossellomorea sp. YZS02]|uniref:helix-turn-helix domain-containing protein n=1 Tax=Rossellomorea sp. YZS02 TaxID=3097358 RepID=UPI002A1761EC|nr:helix-turn-helix transcriptional regulator [Rossellomorea sp. YZS02]MDX8344117.1 helix-turn-helix transcriptional regulator [Rossellomorea sp. YZS02]
MDLHVELQHYRNDVLELTQREAALRLNINQSTLSNYENGTRDIPYKMLLTFKEVYKIPTHEMNRIMYGEKSDSLGQSHDPMILREHFEDDETREIMKILQDYPKLKRTLSSLSYFTEKRKEKFTSQVYHLYQTMKDW